MASKKIEKSKVDEPIEALPINEEKLTAIEEEKLKDLEQVIKRNVMAFQKVGMALKEIKDKRLYRQDFRKFEDYCRDKWNMGRNYAYKQIRAAEVMEHLGTTAPKLPVNESQVRALTTIKLPEDQIKIWKKALEVAPEENPTAKLVNQKVLEFKRKGKSKKLSDYDSLIKMIDDFSKNAWKIVNKNKDVIEKNTSREIKKILKYSLEEIERMIKNKGIHIEEALNSANTIESNVMGEIMGLYYEGYMPDEMVKNDKTGGPLQREYWNDKTVGGLIKRWIQQEKDGEISFDQINKCSHEEWLERRKGLEKEYIENEKLKKEHEKLDAQREKEIKAWATIEEILEIKDDYSYLDIVKAKNAWVTKEEKRNLDPDYASSELVKVKNAWAIIEELNLKPDCTTSDLKNQSKNASLKGPSSSASTNK